MSSRDPDVGRLGRLLQLLSIAGLIIRKPNEAGRSSRTARPTADRPIDPDRGDDPRAIAIPRQHNNPQRHPLLAAMGEVERPRIASSERPPRDLSEMLADIGYQIAQHGTAAEPRIRTLADVLRATRPVAAAVVASPAEPDIVRARAFLHLARAAARQPQPQRNTLAAALATMDCVSEPMQHPSEGQDGHEQRGGGRALDMGAPAPAAGRGHGRGAISGG
jgi:hypothetical protein